jgi:hypothetical protein
MVPSGVTVYATVPAGAMPGTTIQVAVPISTAVHGHAHQDGGHYTSEKYCGVLTFMIAIFVFPCVCCCPCDERMVYVDAQGHKHYDHH